MNRSTFALFVALLIHLLFVLIFWILGAIMPEIKKKNTSEDKRIQISLKELIKPAKQNKKVKTTGDMKESPKSPEIAPPMVKGKQLKEIVKKAPVKFEPKIKAKVPKLNPKPDLKPKKKIIKQPKPTQKTEKRIFIPMLKKEKKEPLKEEKESPLMNWLYEDKAKFEKPETKMKRSHGTSTGRNIKELYGSKFGELSQAQQEYILDNQEIMRRITQQVLTRQASVSDLRGLNVNKINVIEFYLHPNGDMSDFKFLQKSGYFILDNITKLTIDYAYSKYPRPKEKTLIRYNVFYNLISH